MKLIQKQFLILLTFFAIMFVPMSFTKPIVNPTFKCLLQLSNYNGEGAYVIVSLLDAKGKYIKTIQVMGKDKKWYDDLTSWYRFNSLSKEKVDAVSGASITAGGRKIFSFSVAEEYYNNNYQLRFETAVEDNTYHEKDVQFALNDQNVGKNINGQGYIRYIKLFKTN